MVVVSLTEGSERPPGGAGEGDGGGGGGGDGGGGAGLGEGGGKNVPMHTQMSATLHLPVLVPAFHLSRPPSK